MKRTGLAVLLLSLVGAMAAVPASATTLYSNVGPDSYGAGGNAYTINEGQGITNSFTLSQNSTVTGVDFVAWVFSGDTLTNVDWDITTGPFSGDIASGTGTAVTSSNITSAGGFDINAESFSVPSLSLSAGTYWLDLQNAVTAGSNPAFWDWSGGPSQGAWSYYGTNEGSLPLSQTFEILGPSNTPPVPEPSSFLLLGSGLVGLAGMIRRKIMV